MPSCKVYSSNFWLCTTQSTQIDSTRLIRSKPSAKLFWRGPLSQGYSHFSSSGAHLALQPKKAKREAEQFSVMVGAPPDCADDGDGSSDRFVDDVGVACGSAGIIPANICSMTSGSRTMSGSTSTASSSRHRSSCRVCTPCTEEHFNSTTITRTTDTVVSLCGLDRCPSPVSCGCPCQSVKRERIRQQWRRKLAVRRTRKHRSSCSVVVIVGASVVLAAAIGLCTMTTTLELTPSTINILWQKNLERIRGWNQDNIDTSEQMLSSTSTLNYPKIGNGLPGQESSLGGGRIRNADDYMSGKKEDIDTIALNARDKHGQRNSNSGRLVLQVADLSALGGDKFGASMSEGDSIIHRDQPEGAISITRGERAPVASRGASIARYGASSKLPRMRRRSLKSSKSSKTKSYAKKSTNKYRQSKQSKGGGSGSSISSRSHGNTRKGYNNRRRRPRPSESSDSKSSRSSSSGEDGDWRTTLDKLRARADETERADDQGAASTEEEDFYQFFLMDEENLSSIPTYSPTSEPTPTYSPTVEPTAEPSDSNTESPTFTSLPTVATDEPTFTMQPTTSTPEPTTLSPTFDPTLDPTGR